MAKNEKSARIVRDLSRSKIESLEELKNIYNPYLSGQQFVAYTIAELDGAIKAACPSIFYAASKAQNESGEEIFAWITREQAQVLGQIFKNAKINKFELQYTTWEDGAFGAFVTALGSSNSKVEKLIFNCHSADEFTRDQGSYLADLVALWKVENLVVRSAEFLPEALDELASRLDKSGTTHIQKIELKSQGPAWAHKGKGLSHAGLKGITERNKKAG